jgi:phytoene synthase
MTTTAARTISLAESYAWCQSLARRRAGNFYFSFLTLPRERFRDMCVLYAYMRMCDDLGDNELVSPQERAAQLFDWREKLRQALEEGRFDHAALPALARIVQKYGIPSTCLFDVIAGVEADLEPRTYRTFDELSRYCYHVAGAVGVCCISIWGFRHERAIQQAVDCGTAFQLTNILRDLGEDIAVNRVYLPQEDLDRFAYTSADLAVHCRDERFEELMRFEVARAREYYCRAELLFDALDGPGRAVYSAMLRIYSGLLAEIERRRYDVFSSRISLPRRRKLLEVARAVVRHRCLGGIVPLRKKSPPCDRNDGKGGFGATGQQSQR